MAPSRLTRRVLLQTTVLSTAALISTPAHVRAAGAGDSSAVPRLIVVLLRGGVDGLSVVAPHGDPDYASLRPTIALSAPGQPQGLLPLGGLFGLHPALSDLYPYWSAGQLAFVHASGSQDPTRSHFDAQDYMESGTPGIKPSSQGWLNRLAQLLAEQGDKNRLLAVNMGPVMPKILAGPALVASLPAGKAAFRNRGQERPELAREFAKLYDGEDALHRTVREAVLTRREIMKALASDDPAADLGAIGLAGLPGDMRRLGALMSSDARVRLAFVPVGGWDTHFNQGAALGALAARLKLLNLGLNSLVTGLSGALASTTILVLSEFGRTVRQNGTGGTDHGHGNVAMVLGGGVRGGRVLGRWPGLDASALHEGRDLAVTTDFRDIVADILERRFRLTDRQLATVLPGMPVRAPVGLFG